MGRKYMVISSFFVALLALCVLCYGSYRHAEQVAEQKKQEEKENVQAGKVKEQKTTSKTKYRIERYDSESEEMVKEERSIPVQYVGVTRTQLEKILKEELAKGSGEGEQRITNMELISFSEEEIIIRKVYAEQEEEGFVLKIVGGEVVVYDAKSGELYEMTGLQETDLLPEDREALQNGYEIKNEKELYSILENFSS